MNGKIIFEIEDGRMYMTIEGEVGVNEILNAMNSIINGLLDCGFTADELIDIFDDMLFLEEPVGEC